MQSYVLLSRLPAGAQYGVGIAGPHLQSDAVERAC
jgi:hypothetical protein